MDIRQIIIEILTGTFSNDQLNSISDAIRQARAQLNSKTRQTLRVGNMVKFTSTRNGVTYTGKVERVKIKFVVVGTPQGRYNVPASMLEVVT